MNLFVVVITWPLSAQTCRAVLPVLLTVLTSAP